MTAKTTINKSDDKTNKEIYSRFEKKVKAYIASKHAKDEFIYSLSEMYNDIYKNFEFPEIPKSTFYRYLKKMNFKKHINPCNGRHYYEISDSDDDTDGTLLEFDLSFKKYNKTLHATVAPHLGTLLAEFLNCNFNPKIFFATYTQGLLNCYYQYQKEPDKDELGKSYLTSEYIKKEIRRITKTIACKES